ncbi:antibiotic biosynthesis monooxygenase [Kitasatospora sp. NA04385]|uniref:putative quinol monooxygenase n=1 Tax=Kitasatospora sp. NA04385 TaxID=2742135 RepID=UPI00159077C9|nr:antibiotic biosynthesis monooxygenase [Kitasatospora sp. NA04385]QKW23384.1 antibiotic biosynthesis monooxygenase [Kitasatospora sp. NA04385]
MSVLVLAVLRARPERADALESALLALVGPTRAEPGCLAYTVARAGERFLVAERYADAAARDAHFAAPYVTALLGRFPQLLSGEPLVESADVLDRPGG